MDDELRAAVERFRDDDYHDTCDGTWSWEADCHVIADAYIRDLDQRAAQQAERELPITRERLQSLGSVRTPDDVYPDSYENDNESFYDGMLIFWEYNGLYWMIRGYDQHNLRTMGQVFDLLSAFRPLNNKANEKGEVI